MLLILSGVGGAPVITLLFALIIAMTRHGWFCRPSSLRWAKSENSAQFPLGQIEQKPTLSQEELRPAEFLYQQKLTV